MYRTVLLAGLSLCLAFAVTARADEKPEKGKPEPKVLIIQLDASKLPPDVLKRLMELAEEGKGTPAKPDDKKEGPRKVPPGYEEAFKKFATPVEPEKKPEEDKKGPPTLPPGLAKKLGALPEGKPEPGKKPEAKESARAISLSEAIAIAEKTAKGTAVEAERSGEGGDVHFKVEVVGKDGQKQKVVLDASGKVQAGKEKEDDEKKGEEKNKNKKDDDDDKKGEKKPGKKKNKKDDDD